MFRDRQREQRSAGSPRKGNWTMAALRMNGGEEKEEKAMEFTGKQIQEARERIAPFVDETPLLRLKALDAYLGCQVYVKAECMQSTTSAPSSIIAFFLASGAVRGITITALAPFILAP